MLYIMMAALGLYGVFIATLYFSQRQLLYHPDQTVAAPVDYDLAEVKVVKTPTADGFSLHAWWRPPADSAKPIIVYFHGNAGHIGDRAHKVKPYLDAGYGLLLMSYRYNAKAGGSPSEAGLLKDGEAALAFAAAAGYDADRLVLYGESLGSGVAVELAARHSVAGLVLEAPYTDMGVLAQHHYWYAPAKWLLKDRFRSINRIAENRAPVLVFHGDRDRVIPMRFGRRLLDTAAEPKEFRAFRGAAHNNLYDFGAADSVLDFLARHVGR